MSLLKKLKNAVLDVLFPPICLSCQNFLFPEEKENKICRKCLDSVFVHSSFFCSICKARRPDDKKICHQEAKYILAAATDYQNDMVRNLIHFLKYNGWSGLIKTIEPSLQKYFENLNYNFSEFIIIPIPLHRERLRERGFNQAELIAEVAVKFLNIPLEKDILKRIKETETQAKLKNSDERKINVQKCFALENPEKIKNKKIILVDDVHTSGATISEAARILKSAGAKKIIAFVFAKT